MDRDRGRYGNLLSTLPILEKPHVRGFGDRPERVCVFAVTAGLMLCRQADLDGLSQGFAQVGRF